MQRGIVINKIFILGVIFTLAIPSCINPGTSQKIPAVKSSTSVSGIQINKEYKINLKKGAEIRINISNINFNNKAYSNAVQPKTSVDVKSYKIFLTQNYDDPFATGANIFGDGNFLTFNKDPSGINSAVFFNVPDGGPYYAVVAAFDGDMSNLEALNITKPDLTILSIDKKWARSINTVTVLQSNPVYSDNSAYLYANIYLDTGIPSMIDSSVSVIPGNPIDSSSATIQ